MCCKLSKLFGMRQCCVGYSSRDVGMTIVDAGGRESCKGEKSDCICRCECCKHEHKHNNCRMYF